ncbi:MAG TPA: histidine kinase dimerization/phosphoacceptor domain -containing protein [Roseomonas sp.]|nr:histidine kinase dimerization/phosphoacceptor domain -containing protein [Roseomonas sp.]
MGQMMRGDEERVSFLLDMPAAPHTVPVARGLTHLPGLEGLAGWPRMMRATAFGRAAQRTVDLALAVFGTPAAMACFLGRPADEPLVQHGLDLASTVTWDDWQALARRSAPCVIGDAWEDSWLARHPLASGPAGIRFYAAAPLRDRLGRHQGVLAILSPEPRPQGLSPQEQARLQSLADMMMAERAAGQAARQVAEAESAARRCEQLLRNQAHVIQEMDHRIRNGLQVVSDMLCLQSGTGQDESLAARLASAAGRIQAVAEVHTQLQRRPGEDALGARACLDGLLHAFRRLWQGSGRNIFLQEGPDALVAALDAPRLGIVAWELLANAMRHGQGDVTLALLPEESPQRLRLVVRDEGPGSERIARAAEQGGGESGLGLLRIIAGGEPAQVRYGPPTEVSIVLDLPPAA